MLPLTLRLLSQEDIIKCDGLNMQKTLEDIEEFFSLETKGKVIFPSKTILRWGDVKSEETKGRMNCMPGYVGGNINIPGIKWIGSAPLNPLKYNLPRASAVTILNDPDKLTPIAIMDGTLISAMRTGAVTGVGAKYLARSDSEVVGLIGAGVQNKNVVVTATTSVNPIIKKDWFKKGVLYAQIGGNECEAEAVKSFDKFVVDNWTEVLHRGIFTIAHMYKDGKFKKEDLHSTIGEIIIKEKSGRENEKERILYSPVGMGSEDIMVASRIYKEAVKKDIGIKFDLWQEPFSW